MSRSLGEAMAEVVVREVLEEDRMRLDFAFALLAGLDEGCLLVLEGWSWEDEG